MDPIVTVSEKSLPKRAIMSEEVNNQKPTLSDGTYNRLKWFTQYVLPGLGTLYFALSNIWGLPYGEEVVGTIVATTAFLGLILGISTHNYNNNGGMYGGTLKIDTSDPNKDIYSLEVDGPVEDLKNRDSITFYVKPGAHV